VTAKKDPKTTLSRRPLLRFGKDTGLPELAHRLQEEKPRLLLFAGTATDLRRLRRELREPALPVLFGGEEGSVRTFQEDRETGNKVYLVTAFVVDAEGPHVQEFVKQFKANFRDEPDVHAALAYDDARLLFEAM